MLATTPRFRAATFLILAASLAVPQIIMAGPPLVCHPFQIGGAPSLPWGGGGWEASLPSYDTSHLAQDTLNLLKPQAPVIVRMETLRRAAIYCTKNPLAENELFMKLRARVADSEASGHPDPLAKFDYGYFNETLKQASWTFPRDASGVQHKVVRPNAAMNVEGLVYVEEALKLRGEDSEMEFAAALITCEGRAKADRIHTERALAGAAKDPLLAQNLRASFAGERSGSLQTLLLGTETATR